MDSTTNDFQLPLPMFGDERRKHTFYAIVNTITGKRYVGMTTSFQERQWVHISDLRRNNHHSTKLQNAYNKYGESAFEWKIIERGIFTLEESCEHEMYWIAYFDSFNNGYNMTIGGEKYYSIPCEWNNARYNSITEASIACGIDITTMVRRIQKGYTSDADLVDNKIGCTWNNLTFDSITECARHFKVGVGTMWQRIRVLGYTSDEDLQNSKKGRNGIPTIWNNTEYDSILAAATATGVSESVFRRRLEAGYTGDNDMPGKGHNAIPCVWNGKWYPSQDACATALGISQSALRYRLGKGYTSDSDLKRD